MKKIVPFLIIPLVVGIFLFRREPKPPDARVQSVTPTETSDIADKGLTPPTIDPTTSPSPPAGTTASVNPPDSSVPRQELSPALENKPLSLRSARQQAYFSTAKAINELDKQKQLSENHPPPGPNEAKHFRGFIYQGKPKYIEMRFDADKWVVFEGDTPEAMTPWPRRDVIPFQDQFELWTLYYPAAQHLVLQHFPKVNVPELEGDFEVLSGWYGNQDIWRLALIGWDKTWPSEPLIRQLCPEKTDHE